jgi:hypothetical protein
MSETRIPISPESLAGLGSGQIAFVKAIKSEEIRALFPDAPSIAPGQKFWALLDAGGTPLMISDSREAVVMNAHDNDLETVSLQ